jgi:hypothetical protein
VRINKTLVGIAGGVAAATLAAGSASAFVATNITDLVSPSDVAGTTDRVEVVSGPDGLLTATQAAGSGESIIINFSGFAPNTNGINYQAMLCSPKANTPGYDALLECINLNASPVLSTTGSGVINAKVGDGGNYARTQNADRIWECDATGSPAGITDNTDYGSGPSKLFNRCFIVVREQGGGNDPSKNQLFPVEFVADEPDPVIPEAPYGVLLPLGGLAAAAGAYVVLRRRTPAVV